MADIVSWLECFLRLLVSVGSLGLTAKDLRSNGTRGSASRVSGQTELGDYSFDRLRVEIGTKKKRSRGGEEEFKIL